jgi:hypothetical protein
MRTIILVLIASSIVHAKIYKSKDGKELSAAQAAVLSVSEPVLECDPVQFKINTKGKGAMKKLEDAEWMTLSGAKSK